MLDRGERAGERRLAGEAGAAGGGDAEQRVAARRHRRQQRGEPGGRVVAGQEVERQRCARRARRSATGVASGAAPARATTSAPGGAACLKPSASGVPAYQVRGPIRELAVPVAEGEEGEAGGLGPVGRDQRRVAVLAEALHRAVGEADAQRAGGRRGLGHAGGQVAARPALGAGRGQEDRRRARSRPARA